MFCLASVTVAFLAEDVDFNQFQHWYVFLLPPPGLLPRRRPVFLRPLPFLLRDPAPPAAPDAKGERAARGLGDAPDEGQGHDDSPGGAEQQPGKGKIVVVAARLRRGGA